MIREYWAPNAAQSASVASASPCLATIGLAGRVGGGGTNGGAADAAVIDGAPLEDARGAAVEDDALDARLAGAGSGGGGLLHATTAVIDSIEQSVAFDRCIGRGAYCSARRALSLSEASPRRSR